MSPNLIIGIFNGATNSILQLRLLFLNLRIYSVYSDEFKRLLRRLVPYMGDQQFEDFEYHFNESGYFNDSLFALVPIDKNRPVSEETFLLLQTALLVMFPSNFKLVGLAHYSNRLETHYMMNHLITYRYNLQTFTFDDPESHYLDLDLGNLKHINSFIKLFFKRYPSLNSYLNVAFSSYIEAFKHLDVKMAYTNYFMAFDSLADATTETTHRIARICAVLNSGSKPLGKVIYKNYSNFYALRSSIVHGGTPRKMQEYYYNIQALISNTLIELILMNFPNKAELNATVIASGFGEKRKLVKVYKPFQINNLTAYLLTQEVSPYRRG